MTAALVTPVLTLQAQGLTNRQMAERLGVSRASIWRATQAAGSPTPNRRIRPPETWERAKELLDDGCSASEVARTLGVTVQAVLAHFPGRGWTPAQSNAHRRTLHGKRWSANTTQGVFSL